jgi:hypothetical protein
MTWKLLTSLERRNATGQAERQVVFELLFSSSGTVHMKFISEGVTVKEHHYKEILHVLCSSIHRNNPECWSL